MGKTKTAFISGEAVEEKTGKAAYEEKRRKKEAKKKEEEKKKAQVAGVGLKGGERIKVVTGEVLPDEPSETPSAASTKPRKPPKIRGKKYQSLKAKIDRNKLYPLKDAIKLVKETSFSKFNGTMELHLVSKKKGISERVALPFSTGKKKKVEIADDKTIEKLKKGKIDFDILLATAEMMPKLVPFAKLLGPKGLMPNPKQKTLIKNAKEAERYKGNTVSIKTEKDAPVIHTVVGKVDQKDEELEKNIEAIFDALDRRQIIKAYLKSTMSPSLKIAI